MSEVPLYRESQLETGSIRMVTGVPRSSEGGCGEQVGNGLSECVRSCFSVEGYGSEAPALAH